MASDSSSRRILLLSILFLSTAMLGVLFGRACNRRSSHQETKSIGQDGQPIHAQARGKSASSRVIVKGDYQVDTEPPTFCTLNADKAFQITWRTTPEVVLRIENFRGAGEYEGEARVRSTYTGEAYRTSKGQAKVSIQSDRCALRFPRLRIVQQRLHGRVRQGDRLGELRALPLRSRRHDALIQAGQKKAARVSGGRPAVVAPLGLRPAPSGAPRSQSQVLGRIS